MNLTIHHGTHEIGGSCVELRHGDRRILLDLGLPLDPETPQLDASRLAAEALIVSHPHMDHFGLMEHLPKSIPIYMGRLGKELINATKLFFGKPLLDRHIQYFEPWKPFDVAGFTVTPYLMDHSSPEAFAFLVENGSDRLFYTGDFRAHGRKAKLFEKLLASPPGDIDVLLMEGTMLGRDNEDFPTESSVEEKIVETIRNQEGISFLITSSQNIDRLASAFRACKRTQKTLVVDLYTAWVLEQMKLVSQSVPNMDWDGVQVYIPGPQYKRAKENSDILSGFLQRAFHHRIQDSDLLEEPYRYLWVVRAPFWKQIKKYQQPGPIKVIYSQWLGYLDERHSCAGYAVTAVRQMVALRDELGSDFVFAHTSGHAVVEDLKKLVAAVNPRVLIAIHTAHPDAFPELFPRVVRLDDRQEYSVGSSRQQGVVQEQ